MKYTDLILKSVATGARLSNIGKTFSGLDIPILSKGCGGGGGVLLVGGVHARDKITSDLLLRMLAAYHGDYPVDCVPMLNIDGCLLANGGFNDFTLKIGDRKSLLAINGGSWDFSLWKANLRGVDLNVNFDAAWGTGNSDVFHPAPENYVGTAPESEPETRALVKLLLEKDYSLVVAYHTKGEKVCWGFGKDFRWRGEAAKIARALGYALNTSPGSAGGIKDYWTLTRGRLGLTVECGEDGLSQPIGQEHLESLVKRHSNMIELYTVTARTLWTEYGI